MSAATLLSTAALVALLAFPPLSLAESAPADTADHSALEHSLEQVRQALRIPGMTAAVVRDQQLVWARGFGHADVENGIEASPATPFGLASVTKPIAATLIMRLVEEGLIELDAPVSRYGVDVPEGAEVTVRHLLTHTSEGIPGTVHRYNGSRYGLLGGVIEGATGKTFAELLSDRVLLPLGMMDTALNPFSEWGGLSLSGMEEFRRGLGWGESFEHYPDVYMRLAKPYQFDEAYDLIPGKYHLIHNPAGGLISSVSDLAKFDIALDQGLLLGDEARAAMLAPAIATVSGRSDLTYGLGWYVQDFAGTRLLWHAGRWEPSTSALYVKVPAEGLTFVVLANTDNLTVPFPGIGRGDLSRSTLALTFFRHFLFPRQHGYELPSIDWMVGEEQILGQLAAVDDETSRAFLERELWSFRQAYASSGQHQQADVLMRSAIRAFPDSTLRQDPSYTTTTGRNPIVPPLSSARSFVWLSRAILPWAMVVLASLVWMIARLVRTRETAWNGTVWLLATVLLGPIAPLGHWVARRGSELGSAKTMRQAFCASLFCVTGYAVGWMLAIVILLSLGDEPNPLAILGAVVVLPITVDLLWIRAPLLRRGGIGSYRTAVSRGVLAELITWSIAIAVLFSITLYVDNRWLSLIPYPTSPYFWAMMSLMTILGLVALMPLHYGMRRRGFSIWPPPTVPDGTQSAALRLPTLRNSWWLLLVTFGIMVATVGFSVSTFA